MKRLPVVAVTLPGVIASLSTGAGAANIMLRRRTFLPACAILAGVATLLGTGSAAAADPATEPLEVHSPEAGWTSFSPNGDGRQDTTATRYTLTMPAKVYVRVSRNGDTIRSYRLGRLTEGTRALRWDGRRARGVVVGDGFYTLTFRAVRGSETVRVIRTVQVDTLPPSGTIRSNRTVVHPATTRFADQIRFKFSRQRVDAAVRRLDGTLVRRLSVRAVPCTLRASTGAGCGLIQWDGRDASGTVVKAGPYVLRSAVADQAGNRRVARTRVTVSDKPLVEHIRTTTVDAAQLAAAPPPCEYAGGPLSCGDYTCAPVGSDRFPGGLSFRSGTGCSSEPSSTAVRYYTTSGETGHEQFRVTATGGPTTPGSADYAYVGGMKIQGDGAFQTPWMPVERAFSEVDGLGEWSVAAGDGNAYDIASYTLETTYFEAAP